MVRKYVGAYHYRNVRNRRLKSEDQTTEIENTNTKIAFGARSRVLIRIRRILVQTHTSTGNRAVLNAYVRQCQQTVFSVSDGIPVISNYKCVKQRMLLNVRLPA